jgi:type VI protein secretion system component Hcp
MIDGEEHKQESEGELKPQSPTSELTPSELEAVVGGGSNTRVSHQDIQITKVVDKSTSTL